MKTAAEMKRIYDKNTAKIGDAQHSTILQEFSKLIDRAYNDMQNKITTKTAISVETSKYHSLAVSLAARDLRELGYEVSYEFGAEQGVSYMTIYWS